MEYQVTIDSGLSNWQIFQQNHLGTVDIKISGRWFTHVKRKRPNICFRISKEGTQSAISTDFEWISILAKIDKTVTGDQAGKTGTWSIVLKNVPCGGPYRLDTSIGDLDEDAAWRPGGQTIHFFGVGDVFLIAGQSNSVGFGKSPINDPSEIGVHHFGPDKKWELAAHGHLHNPWISLAKQLKSELGYPIGLIPTAVGGSPISKWIPTPKGILFKKMKETLNQSSKDIKAVLWYQGESDTSLELRHKYKPQFTRFVTGIRRFTKNEKLPILTVQLNRLHMDEPEPGGWDAIREYQRQLSNEIKNVLIISIFESILSDAIHNGSEGNILIAQRAYDTLLGAVYGKKVNYKHPECKKVKLKGKNKIALIFDNVYTRLVYNMSLKNGCAFKVQDENSEVNILNYTMQGKNIIELELERNIEGATTVTGVHGTFAQHVLPKDISGYRSILAFTHSINNK
jgi:sialate O-acetylesterase